MNLKEKRTNFINADRAISGFLKDINKYKVLSQSEEEELVARVKDGDLEAKDLLIAANQRFVYALAKQYGNDENVLDLVQEGNMGLILACESFDPDRGVKFLSHAVWYIKREMHAYLNTDNHLIRKTNNTKTVYKIPKIKAKFYAENGRYPDVDEILEILETEYGLKIKDKNDLLDVTTMSINTCFDDEDAKAFENSPYFTEKTAVDNDYDEEIDQEYNSAVSGAMMSILSERERLIVKLAFGIGCNKEFTNAEIAEDIGMSPERVRQLKNGAIEKMRKYAVAEHLSF